jgi:ankyrin repeat protein
MITITQVPLLHLLFLLLCVLLSDYPSSMMQKQAEQETAQTMAVDHDVAVAVLLSQNQEPQERPQTLTQPVQNAITLAESMQDFQSLGAFLDTYAVHGIHTPPLMAFAVLEFAVHTGSLPLVQFLILNQELPGNVKNTNNNRTLVHAAAYRGHETMIKFLIQNSGVDANHPDNAGVTALHIAVREGYSSVVDVLITIGHCDVTCFDDYGRMPLHYAAQTGNDPAIQSLMRCSAADINQTTKTGESALYLAVWGKCLSTVKLLSETYNAAVPGAETAGLYNLMVVAVNQQDLGMVQYLASDTRVDADKKGTGGVTPLYLAVQRGYVDIVDSLLTLTTANIHVTSPGSGATLLHVAVEAKNMQMIQLLLDHPQLDCRKSTQCGTTALHLAAKAGLVEIVRLLVGAPYSMNPNRIDNQNRTALHLAAQYGHLPVVQNLVLHHGADLDAVALDGRTALDMATEANHRTIMQFFIDQDRPYHVHTTYSSADNFQH